MGLIVRTMRNLAQEFVKECNIDLYSGRRDRACDIRDAMLSSMVGNSMRRCVVNAESCLLMHIRQRTVLEVNIPTMEPRSVSGLFIHYFWWVSRYAYYLPLGFLVLRSYGRLLRMSD